MAETIEAKNKTLSKEQANAAGVTITSDDLALSSDNLAVSSNPGPSVKQEDSDWFVSDRALHLTADDKVVEEDDPAGVKVLVGKGGRISAAEAAKYGLGGKSAAQPEVEDEKPALKGKLPDDFPGRNALEAAGLTTYAKVRKSLDTLEELDGIGPATAEKIRDAMSEAPEDEEE